MSLPRKLLRAAMAAIALAACAQAAIAAQAGTPNPYSFADLFNLTVGAQHGLISGTTMNPGGPGRTDWTQPSQFTPALFGGANVPGLTLAPGPVASSMIGLPERPGEEDYAFRFGTRAGPMFEVHKEIFPLSRVPEPAGWLILASGLAVAVFIGRRRAGGPR